MIKKTINLLVVFGFAFLFVTYYSCDRNINPDINNPTSNENIDINKPKESKKFSYPDISTFIDTLNGASKMRLSKSTATATDYTYSIRIECQPYDKNGNPIPISIIEENVAFALSVWSSACNVSFKRISWNPSAPANLNFAFQHHYLGSVCGASGSWDGTTTAWYCFTTCSGGYTPILWGGQSIQSTAMHEAGHALGLPDLQMTNWSAQCPVDDGHGTYAPMPSPRGGMLDPNYWNWRMANLFKFSGECTTPYGYNPYMDTRVSIMDYDFGGKAPYRPNHIGFWGRPDDPDNGQPAYIADWDIQNVTAIYGSPSYYPIITVLLTKDWQGNVYNGSDQTGGSAYVTTDWVDASAKVKQFVAPADVRWLEGLSMKNYFSGCRGVYRYFRKYDEYNRIVNDYCLSTSVSLSGWTRESFLGYWKNSSGSITLKIGNTTRTCSTIPIYQFYKTSIGMHLVTTQNMTDGYDGWTQKQTIGYIVAYSQILKP